MIFLYLKVNFVYQQIVKTLMKYRIMRHFIWVFVVCQRTSFRRFWSSKGYLSDNIACFIVAPLLGLELAIDPPPPMGNFEHYDFLKLHYIRHKIKDVSRLRVAALTCNVALYTLLPPPPPK